MEEHVAIVRGKHIEKTAGDTLRTRAAAFDDVVVDLGAGDGRWLYRFARRRPDALCIGIDANADLVRDVSRRALRSPRRGGAPNLVFLRASMAALPGSLAGIAAMVRIQFPWGSLLRAVVRPEVESLTRIADLLGRQGALEVLVNLSAISQSAVLERLGIPARSMEGHRDHMRSSYAAAGLLIKRWEVVQWQPDSTWAGRLGQGRPVPTLRVEAKRL